MDTDKLVDVLFVWNLESEQSQSSRQKPSKHRIDKLREISHETSPIRLGFSGERNNELTACASRVSLKCFPKISRKLIFSKSDFQIFCYVDYHCCKFEERSSTHHRNIGF